MVSKDDSLPKSKYAGKVKSIIVSGPVGAGKTTFVRALKLHLELQGLRVCDDSITAFPLFSYIFFKLLACMSYGCKVVKAYEKIKIHPSTLVLLRVKKIPSLITLIVMYLEILSVFLRYLKILFCCIRRDAIIIDEGLINMFANYIEIFGKKSAPLMFYVRTVFEKLRRMLGFDVDIVFISIKDYSMLLDRWYKRKYPLLTSLVDADHHFRYLKFIEISKNIIANIFGQYIIELNADKKTTYELVLEYLNNEAEHYI